MRSYCRSLLLLSLSIFSLHACTDKPKKTMARTPVVCKDTSKHDYVLDTVKGYQLKYGKELSLLLNLESFNTKKEFDQYFERPPIPADSTPPSLNFNDNWLVGILVDNRTPNPSYPDQWIDVSTKLFIGKAYTENCELIIPFSLIADERSPYGLPAPERKFMLFSIPRSAQFNEVFFRNMGGSLSRHITFPAAAE